jgi:hypothetical protein
MTHNPPSRPLYAPPRHDPAPPAPPRCPACGSPLSGHRARFCSSRCRLAAWEMDNPRLRRDMGEAELRAVLRAYCRARYGRGGRLRVRF